jgi:signal transduction histidine kinase
VQNRLYGSLTIYFAAPHLFSPEDMLVAQTLAEQTALAIDNARYYLEVRRKAVASERTRLAHDLHDSVTQTLFSASIIADILPRLWEVRPEEGRRRLQDLRELARGALAEMRSLLLELRPETMKTVILPELLQQLTTAFIGRSRLPVHLVLPEECDMPETVRMAFYRITQEALNNVTKHADATRVSLVLNCLPRRVELLIGDDGRGFDPTHVTGNHLGLNIMSERAKGIGATLRVDSTPGKGTEVRVLWRRV